MILEDQRGLDDGRGWLGWGLVGARRFLCGTLPLPLNAQTPRFVTLREGGVRLDSGVVERGFGLARQEPGEDGLGGFLLGEAHRPEVYWTTRVLAPQTSWITDAAAELLMRQMARSLKFRISGE